MPVERVLTRKPAPPARSHRARAQPSHSQRLARIWRVTPAAHPTWSRSTKLNRRSPPVPRRRITILTPLARGRTRPLRFTTPAAIPYRARQLARATRSLVRTRRPPRAVQRWMSPATALVRALFKSALTKPLRFLAHARPEGRLSTAAARKP